MKHKDRLIRLIGIVKLIKAAFLYAFAIGALELVHKDMSAWLAPIAPDGHHHYLDRALAKLATVDPKTLHEVGIGLLIYGSVFVVEGVGLIMRKVWAEYLTVGVTLSLIPLEVYELVEGRSITKFIVILVNIAIAIYLVDRLRRQGHWPFRHHAAEEATAAPAAAAAAPAAAAPAAADAEAPPA
jgi:uncharacterized membrane protein (DUF2068 family)